MLFFFRNIHFTTAITLAVYVTLLHLAALTGLVAPPPPAANSGLLYTDWFGPERFQGFESALLATILVYIQSLIVNGIADTFRFMGDRNWLPGMTYALIASALPDFLYLSPPLVAATFVAVALRFLFHTYKEPKSPMLVFDTAFWLAVGALFFPKTLFLAPALFIGIGVMRSWKTRDQLAFFIGMLVPTYLGWVWYFWHDRGFAFRQTHLHSLVEFYQFNTVLDGVMWAKICLLGSLLMVFFANASSFSRSKSMLVQKSVSTLYWVLFSSAFILLLSSDWHWETFALPAVSAGLFLAFSLHNMRNLYAEILHLCVLCAVIGLQFLT